MPTAPNEINHSVTTLGWPHTLDPKGKRVNDARYKSWREECEEYAIVKSIKKKQGTADAVWAAFKVHASASRYMSQAARTKCETFTEPWHTALEKLLQDILKKHRDSKGKKRRAVALAEMEEEAKGYAVAEGFDAGRWKVSRIENGKPVYIYIRDPEDPTHRTRAVPDAWVWQHLSRSRKVAVLYNPTLHELVEKSIKYIPEGRTVREVIGALENPTAPAGGGPVNPNGPPADWIRLTSDDELHEFLSMTEAKPIRILICLHRKPTLFPPVPNSLSPAGTVRPAECYIDSDMFAEVVYAKDPVEDSDLESRKRAGLGMRRDPMKDHTFEDRIEAIQKRVRRQVAERTRLETKHKAEFPSAIHSSDDGGHLRHVCYGDDDALTGQEAILFRNAIRLWRRKVISMRARAAADQAAGNSFPTDQECIDAVDDLVKSRINAGRLGALPATLP